MIFPLVGPLLVINILSYCNDFSPCGSSIGNKHILSYCNDFPTCWSSIGNKHILSYCNDFSPCGPSIGNKHILSYCNHFSPCGSPIGNKHILSYCNLFPPCGSFIGNTHILSYCNHFPPCGLYWYSTERDIPWSITVIVVMFRRVMGIKKFNSCRWSGGNTLRQNSVWTMHGRVNHGNSHFKQTSYFTMKKPIGR
jgi:hypothetical protein